VTNDNTPELVIEANRLYVFSCFNGKYQTTLVVNPIPGENYSPSIAIQDMNLDGIPELVISRTYGGQTATLQVELLEWDGKQFRSLFAKDNVCSRHISIYACVYEGVPDILGGEVKLADIDNNGTIELIITGGNSISGADAIAYHPTRYETLIWLWNGKEFVLSSMKLSQPYYRFQAIEDGDEASLSKDYEKALALYWQAINDDKLNWWSPSLKEFNIESFGNQTPIPTPIIDSNEYPRLAAYAYYRIMLIYVLQGRLIDAQKMYDILQTKFGKNEQAFTGLATTFWSEYNLSHTIDNACQQTIKYVESNSEIIEKLGVNYYNFLSNQIYQPNDICPFK
jgi:tetratricopeptide (TPR) repeat protein